MASLGRVRRIAATLWRFRYHLAAAAVAVALWDTPLIKPFRLFVVIIHESCHAAAALATGGQVVEMRTHWDESGYTLSRGGWFPLISSAGYVGTALLGSLLIYTSRAPRLQRAVLAVIGAACLLLTLGYTPLGGDFALGALGGFGLLALAIYSARAASAGAAWMGIVLCLYSLHDFRTDLWLHPGQTDAGILARWLGVPLLTVPIALAWVGASMWLMYRSMRAAARRAVAR